MLNSDFKEWLKLLNANNVEYLVVGGHALAAHGHPRYTGDIDIWISADATNVARVLDALSAFGFGSLGLTAADLSTPGSVVQLGYPPTRIDLMPSIDGVEFTGCFARRVVMSIDGIDVPIIGIADFRANKLAVGRHQDLADVEAITPNRGNDSG
ncbi:MAG: nucleotidyltransferase [Betaproteobacteria bacterium]|nr:nucleotidyltransferase [Betaproteobacteria bacterium]